MMKQIENLQFIIGFYFYFKFLKYYWVKDGRNSVKKINNNENNCFYSLKVE